MSISILTPSCRPEGLKLVEKALKRQTYKSFEWIIGSPTKPTIDIPHIWVKDKHKKKDEYWTIYTSYNDMVRKAKGELIISLQDYTYINPDGIEKMWGHYQDEPKTIVTGVGNKYEDEEWIVETWTDPRRRSDQGSFYGVYHNDIEINFASFAKKAFYAVGGFDEKWGNRFSSVCGLDILERLNIIGGWDFKIDQTNETFSLEHGRLKGWDKNTPFNGEWDKRRKEYVDNPVLNYL